MSDVYRRDGEVDRFQSCAVVVRPVQVWLPVVAWIVLLVGMLGLGIASLSTFRRSLSGVADAAIVYFACIPGLVVFLTRKTDGLSRLRRCQTDVEVTSSTVRWAGVDVSLRSLDGWSVLSTERYSMALLSWSRGRDMAMIIMEGGPEHAKTLSSWLRRGGDGGTLRYPVRTVSWLAATASAVLVGLMASAALGNAYGSQGWVPSLSQWFFSLTIPPVVIAALLSSFLAGARTSRVAVGEGAICVEQEGGEPLQEVTICRGGSGALHIIGTGRHRARTFRVRAMSMLSRGDRKRLGMNETDILSRVLEEQLRVMQQDTEVGQ